MRKVRFYIALWASKAASTLLLILGRNASCFPGKVAIKLCPDFLAQVAKPKTVVAVTGTNGKTTVSNLTAGILRENGYTVTNNSLGSNIQPGVATALLQDCTVFGKAKKDIAILECDERSAIRIFPQLKPDFLLCNNIMQDSVMRNAHTEFISYLLTTTLPETTKLVLNGDDMICSSLAPQCQDRTYFGIEAERPAELITPFHRDIVYCPKCGGKLVPDYVRYYHIGRFHCESCGHTSPARDFTVTAIDREQAVFTITHKGEDQNYRLVSTNLVNIYNTTGMIALLTQIGLSHAQITKGLEKAEIVKSRMEILDAGDLHITMLMAKGLNPVACASCFNYVASTPGENKAAVICIDDRNNCATNSANICWFYDCDYSILADPSITQIVFGGPRCKDHYLRALMAGIPKEKMVITHDTAHAAALIDTEKSKEIFVLYDIYHPAEAAVNKKILQEKGGKV